MKRWILLFALTGFAGALTVSSAVGQDETWFDDDDDVLVELDERLEYLGQDLARAFNHNFLWTDEDCEEEEDCDVHLSIDGRKHFVIVNGDTVRTGHGLPHHVDNFSHGPQFDLHANILGPKGMHGDSVLRRLEQESRRIAKETRKAEGPGRDALEKELDEKLNEIFDYKLERQEKAISKAENRLTKLKDRRSKRASAKDDIIQNRKDELLGNARYLEW